MVENLTGGKHASRRAYRHSKARQFQVGNSTKRNDGGGNAQSKSVDDMEQIDSERRQRADIETKYKAKLRKCKTKLAAERQLRRQQGANERALRLAIQRQFEEERARRAKQKRKYKKKIAIDHERNITQQPPQHAERRSCCCEKLKSKLRETRHEIEDVRSELEEEHRQHMRTHMRHYEERLQHHAERMSLISLATAKLRSLPGGCHFNVVWRARGQLQEAGKEVQLIDAASFEVVLVENLRGRHCEERMVRGAHATCTAVCGHTVSN